MARQSGKGVTESLVGKDPHWIYLIADLWITICVCFGPLLCKVMKEGMSNKKFNWCGFNKL